MFLCPGLDPWPAIITIKVFPKELKKVNLNLIHYYVYHFESFKQKRGVDDPEKLPFYPYRDDGLLLYAKLDEFVDDYVDA